MKKSICRIAAVILSLCLLFPMSVLADAAGVTKSNKVTVNLADDYSNYLKSKGQAAYPDKTITIAGNSFSGSDYIPEIKENDKGEKGSSVLSEESGYIEWSFDISAEDAGFYNISLLYYPVKGKSAGIVRSIEIDGSLPFNQARSVVFNRIWIDEKDENGKAITQDPMGNDLRPMQIEDPNWIETFLKDSSGYIEKPLYFYFSEGKHTLRLTAIQEPMLISDIRLTQYQKPGSYTEYQKKNNGKQDNAKNTEPIKIQGETALYKSDSMILPISDRSSCATEPNDAVKLKLNCIGGTNWQQSGQWIVWEFNVKESGFYNIGIKYLQNYSSGSSSHRRVYIDNSITFEELNSTAFYYGSKWNKTVLGGNNPYEFYLEKGNHTIKLEVALGEMAELLSEASSILNELNKIYREILMLTGPNPDTGRDYQFDLAIPDTLSNMEAQKNRLDILYKKIVEKTRMNGANVQTLYQLYLQLSAMVKKPEDIAAKFSPFQSNINSLGTWINDTKNQPLAVDYIIIMPKNQKMPSQTKGFFSEVKYQVESFFASFFVDYDKINYNSNGESVSVWVGSGATGGRDQAQVLKTLADNYFTPKTEISAELQLVSMGALLPATLSGKGPDVALSLGTSEAANYAFRNATVNLAEFSDFNEVKSRFYESALTPLTFEGKVFGLPETQTFPMLFYRKDILMELNIDVPETWQDVINILPALQKKQLEFGLPAVGTPGSTLTMFTMLLYQYGGELYSKDGSHTLITTPEAYDSFSFFTSLYTDYLLSKQIDFINRFRMGSVPIGIADYSMYNQLSVFAPELNGLWGFTLVPGIKDKNGNINRTVAGGVTASIIMDKAKNKENAWEFLKWWTDSSTQVQFGRQLESIMGVAARYPTANIQASQQIPWAKENFDALSEQWKSVKGIPEIPGSYFTPRNVDFAFRNAVYNSKDIDDCLTSAAKSINAEINKKRKEFGLAIFAGEEG